MKDFLNNTENFYRYFGVKPRNKTYSLTTAMKK